MAAPVCTLAGQRVEFAVGAGVSAPVQPSELRDQWGPGFLLSCGLEARLTPRWRTSLDVGLGFHAQSSASLGVLPVTLSGMFDLQDHGTTQAYVLAGVGAYTVESTDGVEFGVLHDDADYKGPSETAFGAQLGGGVRTPLGLGVHLCVDALYQIVATNGGAIGFVPLRLRVIF